MSSYLSYQNLIAGATVSLSADSAQPAWPVSRVRDQSPGRTWRSKTGWTVVTGWNNRLDFHEVGGDRAAVIAAGNYPTGALLAAAIQTAMNAVAVSNTYTVSYSGTTHKFTIAGTGSFSIEWQSGPNTLLTIGKDLGFIVGSDDTGGTTYTADGEAYQSRHYVVADFGAATLVEFAGIAGPLGGSATFTVGASDSSALAAVLGVDLLASMYGGDRQQFSTEATGEYRYWAIIVDDVGNESTSNAEIGVVWFGRVFTPSTGISPGLGLPSEPLDDLAYSAAGSHFRFKRATRTIRDVTYRMQTLNDVSTWLALREACGAGGCFWLVVEDLSFVSIQSLYGFLESLPDPQHEPESVSYWTVSLFLREAM